MASLMVMSYADMVLAMVPAAPPTRKNQRATSCPAPISAKVPYLVGSRLICRAFWCVPVISRFMQRQYKPAAVPDERNLRLKFCLAAGGKWTAGFPAALLRIAG